MSDAGEQMQQRVQRINELFQQYRSYNELLPMFDNAPKIVSFSLTADMPPTDRMTLSLPAQVSAEGIEYPPQMIAAIKAQVEKRLGEIGNELQQLGVKPGE